MLLLQLIFDRLVGGERILISIAVPRRIGTRGVSSSATNGRALLSSSVPDGAFPISYASMSPGLIITLQSSGKMLSQEPFSDQANTDATTVDDLLGCQGTDLYPPWDAELDSDRELLVDMASGAGVLGLGGCFASAGASDTASSSDSSELSVSE